MQNLGDQILCLGAWWRWFSPKLCLTLAAPWTVACQPPLSMGFYRQEYWSGLTFPSPGNLPNPGIKPWSPVSQTDTLPSEPPGKPKNTGVAGLSLLQGIVPIQELNPGLLHCKNPLLLLSCFSRVQLCATP